MKYPHKRNNGDNLLSFARAITNIITLIIIATTNLKSNLTNPNKTPLKRNIFRFGFYTTKPENQTNSLEAVFTSILTSTQCFSINISINKYPYHIIPQTKRYTAGNRRGRSRRRWGRDTSTR